MKGGERWQGGNLHVELEALGKWRILRDEDIIRISYIISSDQEKLKSLTQIIYTSDFCRNTLLPIQQELAETISNKSRILKTTYRFYVTCIL